MAPDVQKGWAREKLEAEESEAKGQGKGEPRGASEQEVRKVMGSRWERV